jgi:hypothetical protein
MISHCTIDAFSFGGLVQIFVLFTFLGWILSERGLLLLGTESRMNSVTINA